MKKKQRLANFILAMTLAVSVFLCPLSASAEESGKWEDFPTDIKYEWTLSGDKKYTYNVHFPESVEFEPVGKWTSFTPNSLYNRLVFYGPFSNGVQYKLNFSTYLQSLGQNFLIYPTHVVLWTRSDSVLYDISCGKRGLIDYDSNIEGYADFGFDSGTNKCHMTSKVQCSLEGTQYSYNNYEIVFTAPQDCYFFEIKFNSCYSISDKGIVSPNQTGTSGYYLNFINLSCQQFIPASESIGNAVSDKLDEIKEQDKQYYDDLLNQNKQNHEEQMAQESQQHDELVNGYENEEADSIKNDFQNSVDNQKEQQSELIDNAMNDIGAVDMDVGAFDGLADTFSFIRTVFMAIVTSLGDFGIVLTITLTLAIALYAVGFFRGGS